MKSHFRIGRGIGATPDTVRDAASAGDRTQRRHDIQYNITRSPGSDTEHRRGRGTGQSNARHYRPPRGRMPIRYSTRIFSTHSSAPRRIDARTSTSNFRSGQSSDIT